jgi:hypothetical protein
VYADNAICGPDNPDPTITHACQDLDFTKYHIPQPMKLVILNINSTKFCAPLEIITSNLPEYSIIRRKTITKRSYCNIVKYNRCGKNANKTFEPSSGGIGSILKTAILTFTKTSNDKNCAQ